MKPWTAILRNQRPGIDHNHGSRKTEGINQRNLDPESRFLWNLKKNKHTELDVIF
jgi:hypothetical protein